MTMKYDMLRTYRYRHAETLVVTHVQRIPWRTKPKRVNVWFLVFYGHVPGYNIEVRTVYNDEHATLKQLVEFTHAHFLIDMNEEFSRQRPMTHKDKEAIHLVAIEPVKE